MDDLEKILEPKKFSKEEKESINAIKNTPAIKAIIRQIHNYRSSAIRSLLSAPKNRDEENIERGKIYAYNTLIKIFEYISKK